MNALERVYYRNALERVLQPECFSKSVLKGMYYKGLYMKNAFERVYYKNALVYLFYLINFHYFEKEIIHIWHYLYIYIRIIQWIKWILHHLLATGSTIHKKTNNDGFFHVLEDSQKSLLYWMLHKVWRACTEVPENRVCVLQSGTHSKMTLL